MTYMTIVSPPGCSSLAPRVVPPTPTLIDDARVEEVSHPNLTPFLLQAASGWLSIRFSWSRSFPNKFHFLQLVPVVCRSSRSG